MMPDERDEIPLPTHVGELSTYLLQEAIRRIDKELRDAPKALRDAVETIKLVTSVPRAAPWYGVHVKPLGDNSVSMGTVLRNQAEQLESIAYHISDPLYRHGAEREAAKLRQAIQAGKREYDNYLDHLFDPDQKAKDDQRRKMDQEQAARSLAQIAAYRRY